MRALKLTPQQADAAYTVLVLHAGANDDAADREAFVCHVAHPLRPCEEYRFCGALGWGGKFRNNGNNQGVPYVDFYREHETEQRVEIARNANLALRELFARVEST
jgi:hypothetical protein